MDDPGNPNGEFRGLRLSNETHVGATDPEPDCCARRETRLWFLGHVLMKNRNGLLTDFTISQATGPADWNAVPELLDRVRARGWHPRTLAGDRGYDTQDGVQEIRARRAMPHVAQRQHSPVVGALFLMTYCRSWRRPSR